MVQGVQPLRVAVCFVGLTRSLQYTLQNIRSSILDPIVEQGHEYEIFLHSYNMEEIYNPFVGEMNVKLEWQKYVLLQPDRYVIDDVNQVDELLFHRNGSLDEYLMYNGHSKWAALHGSPTENITVMNMVKQLWSKQQCTQLWEQSDSHFDAVMVLRSDVWFFQPLNASILQELQPDRLYVPDFDHWGGLHDRFAIGSPAVMHEYGNCIELLKPFCKHHPIHSETFLLWAMHEKSVDVSGRLNLTFERVRANGILHACCKKIMCYPFEAGCSQDKLMRWKFTHSPLNHIDIQMQEVSSIHDE